MILLDGKETAKKKREQLRETIMKFETKPTLSVIIVGDNPASKTYVRNKEKACEEVGIHTETIHFEDGVCEEIIIAKIKELNLDYKTNGILLQLPLPKRYNEHKIINTIVPHKDVDALTDTNRANLLLYNSSRVPCTPLGVVELLKEYEISVKHKKVLIIGRSKLVGEPLLILMNKMNATTMWANSFTPIETLKELCLDADIIISCAGKRNLITQDMVTPMTTIIDVGINVDDNGKLCGDVARDVECFAKTPVPGGVGPMTIYGLLHNTFNAFLNL